jgi:hypothetical protein
MGHAAAPYPPGRMRQNGMVFGIEVDAKQGARLQLMLASADRQHRHLAGVSGLDERAPMRTSLRSTDGRSPSRIGQRQRSSVLHRRQLSLGT